MSAVNDNNAFIRKLFELSSLQVQEGFDGLMYSTLLEAFIAEVEADPGIVETAKELISLRFADRIKETIKMHTPEYYKFTCQVNYYDHRLLPILTDECKNKREVIENVLKDKAIELITKFIYSSFPEVEYVLKELDDDVIAFIIPSILEYNRTTISDKEVVMGMILNSEKLFTLRTENSEMCNVIVQTLLEQIENKRSNPDSSKPKDNKSKPKEMNNNVLSIYDV